MKSYLLIPVLALALFPYSRLEAVTIVVSNTNSSGAGSLSQAIQTSNISAGVLDTITFNIPGAGVHTILQNSPLPGISDPVIIDGTTQPGFSGTPLIELNGSNAGSSADGLSIEAGNSTVKGLVINRFGGTGINLTTNGGNVIQGNFIGTDATGTAALGNDTGIFLSDGSDNTIGGTSSQARNLISGNTRNGVSTQLSDHNFIQGNFIGTDITGTVALGNAIGGISIFSSSDNIIGGTAVEMRNLISGNGGSGVDISGSGTFVQGNFIGTDASGTSAIGNGVGVSINDGPNNFIGGTQSGAGNVISGNTIRGVEIVNPGATGNMIQGNLIGLQSDGKSALGNEEDGIFLFSNTPTGNTIGGTGQDARNIIAFNGSSGVQVGDALGTAILGNSIFSNDDLGIDLFDASDPATGVTSNDAGDGDLGANNLLNFPVLTSAEVRGDTMTVQGTLNSAANSLFRLEFFSNKELDPSGNGEGETFLGAKDVTTDDSGNGTFTVALPPPPSKNEFITATTTDASNNTSEFSAGIPVVVIGGGGCSLIR